MMHTHTHTPHRSPLAVVSRTVAPCRTLSHPVRPDAKSPRHIALCPRACTFHKLRGDRCSRKSVPWLLWETARLSPMAAETYLVPKDDDAAPGAAEGGGEEWCTVNLAVSRDLHAWLAKLCHLHAPRGEYAALVSTLGAHGNRLKCTVALCGDGTTPQALRAATRASRVQGVILVAFPPGDASTEQQEEKDADPQEGGSSVAHADQWLPGPNQCTALVLQGSTSSAIPPVPPAAEMLAMVPLVYTSRYTPVVRPPAQSLPTLAADRWATRASAAVLLARAARTTAVVMGRALRGVGGDPWRTLGCTAPPVQGSWPYGFRVAVAVTSQHGFHTERWARATVEAEHGCTTRVLQCRMWVVWDTVTCRPSRLLDAALQVEHAGALFDTRMQLRGVPGVDTAHVSMDRMEALRSVTEPVDVTGQTVPPLEGPPAGSPDRHEHTGWVWVFSA